MNESEMQKKIAVLKCPKFWKISADVTNSRTIFLGGRVVYDVECGYLHGNYCKIWKRKNENVTNCKQRRLCKLYVIKTDEGIVYVKRMNVNAKLPSRDTSGLANYDLSMAQAAVVPVHDKCLVKIGLAIALPPDCYGRVAPRSELALKSFLDVGAKVIVSDYRGELGVILSIWVMRILLQIWGRG